MAELGENVAVLVRQMEKKQKCAFEPDKSKWVCNLAGSSSALGDSLGNKPHASKESEVTATDWPSQAHHLIPHLQLSDHPVKDWLKKGDEIYGDTRYNVDHKNNGLWMPYASELAEWSGASPKRKKALRFKVMEMANVQHHEGAHSKHNTYGVGLTPYKARVNQYLEKIDDNALSHYKGPNKCADCTQLANKVPPRDNTVRFVDKASSLLKKDIKELTIVVSRVAAEFAETVGFDD